LKKLGAIHGACATALLVAVSTSTANAAPALHTQEFPNVSIEGTKYYYGEIKALMGALKKVDKVAKFGGSFWVKWGLKAAKKCGVELRGYYSPEPDAIGLVGWVPTEWTACSPVEGGGPAEVDDADASFKVCHDLYRTPETPDANGLAPAGTDLSRRGVMILGTSPDVCRHLSTQVPGGIWGQLKVPAGGLATGTVVVVKCQRETAEGVWNYVARFSGLPANKAPFWIWRNQIQTGHEEVTFKGVPSC
jgi:hypothetical protein